MNGMSFLIYELLQFLSNECGFKFISTTGFLTQLGPSHTPLTYGMVWYIVAVPPHPAIEPQAADERQYKQLYTYIYRKR